MKRWAVKQDCPPFCDILIVGGIVRLVVRNRRDHKTLDGGVCRISTGKCGNAEIVQKCQNQGNGDSERGHSEYREEHKLEQRNQDQSENCHNTALDAQNREDQCVFEDLSN